MKRLFPQKKLDMFTVFITVLMGLWGLTIIYPYYNALVASIASQKEYLLNPLLLFPKNLTLDAYRFLIKGTNLMIGYRNTFLLLFIGLPMSMLITISTAYVMAKRDYPGKKLINFMILITMYFGGGLIPLYILMKELHLTNSLLGIALLGAGNTFYAILIRNYIMALPEELEESAKIDGANEITAFFRILLPLTAPILATVLLFFAVDKWNEWFNVMIFVRDSSKWTLQVILRDIVFASTASTSNASAMVSVEKTYYAQGLKMAAIMLTMAPVMLFYPFVQRYFVKGILVGAVKG
jgi:putative aldouronate transport system permease protein